MLIPLTQRVLHNLPELHRMIVTSTLFVLNSLQEVLSSYNAELVGDALIASHLNALYDTLLEQNLVRVAETDRN